MSSVQGPARPGVSTVLSKGLAGSRDPSGDPPLRPIASVRGLVLWAVLVLGLVLGLLTTRPPPPVSAKAPSGRFSAERAFAHVDAIAKAAHPTGSPEADAVRRTVFDRFSDLGLQAQIRHTEAAEVRRGDPTVAVAADLQNVIGVLPGADPKAPAVLVMAHSDSVPNSPGAGDDGVGVAVLLETARSLVADGPHRRSVIFLVTDGEEVGLLGARAFFERDPLARQVGAVINMDSRGDAGRTAMFQMGPGSGGLLDVYGRVAATPYANSLTALLFSILPNDTDFTVALGKKLPGLNFAFIGDQLAYHTPIATPAHLAPSTLQSMGGQVLPVTRALADAETLPVAAAPAAYTDLFGLVLTPLPLWSLALLWLLATGLGAFAAWHARKGGLVRISSSLRGAGVGALAVLGVAVALTAASALLGTGFLRDYALVARYPWLLAGCAAVALAAVCAVLVVAARGRGWRALAATAIVVGLLTQAGGWSAVPLILAVVVIAVAWASLRSAVGAWDLWVGVLGVGLLLSLILLVAAPGAAPLFLLPTLLGCLAAAAVFAAGSHERRARAALAAAAGLAVVATGWLCGWASGLFVAVGASLPAVLAPFALLALLGVAPFARWWATARAAPWITAALAGFGLALLAFVGLAPPTAARPSPTMAYAVTEPGRPALFVSPAPRLDAWTRRLMPAARRQTAGPPFASAVWTAPAPASSRGPEPRVEAVRVDDRLILHVYADGAARRLTLWLRSTAALTDPRLHARGIGWALKPGRWSRIDLHAPSPEGFTLSLAAPPQAKVEVIAGQLVDGWPKGAPPPLAIPAGLMPVGDTGSTLALSRSVIGPL